MHHGAAPGDWGGHVWGSFSCGATSGAERSLRLHVRCPPFSRPLCSRIMKRLFILRKLKHHRPSLPRLLSWRRFCHNKRAKQRMDCLFLFRFGFFCRCPCRQRAAAILSAPYFEGIDFSQTNGSDAAIKTHLRTHLHYYGAFFFPGRTLRRVYFTLREVHWTGNRCKFPSSAYFLLW